MLAKFSEKAQKAMAIAESLAFDLGHASVGTEHLLLAFAKIKESHLRVLLERQGLVFEVIKEELIKTLGKKETQPFYMEYTLAMKKLIEKASVESRKFNEERVSIEVLSYCLVAHDDGLCRQIISKYVVDISSLKGELKNSLKRVSELDSIEDLVNLNEKMRASKEVLVQRDEELSALSDALLRKKKPNAILVGEPGVGKTALVEQLALAIVRGELTSPLRDKIIYELDIASVVAGTKYRGEFEEKLKKIIKKVKEDQRAIIFIDEIHNIIGAGGAEGAIDASNILKPYLARGEFQCIGATTYDEYVKIFEKEKGLERRFQMIRVNEPSLAETERMLNGIAPSFAQFHDLALPVELLPRLVDYCRRYITDKYFPDKAIDILDCAMVRAKEKGLEALDEATIIEVIERNHQIKIIKEERALILKKELEQLILGQDQAVNRIVAQIRTIETGLVDDNRPLAVLLFVGPTGVGKSEIAKLVAKSYFGSQERLIKIDMQEYSEPSSVAKLIGSPPGYVGFEKQSYLVDQIRKMPHSVVLIDEVEKGHRDVLDLFLNVFDEGFFVDASKRRVDFRNAIIILTSNLGHGDEVYQKKGLGFVHQDVHQEEVEKAVKMKLRPEFINRLDEIIYFESLTKDVGALLVDRYLKEYQGRSSCEFGFDQGELEKVIENSQIARFGARAVRREVKKALQNKIEQARELIG